MKNPPTELLLLKFGTTETVKGPFELSEDAAILNAGKSIPIQNNFNHEEQPAGWGRTDVREDGIWLTEISLSKKARDLMDGDTTMYIVPAFTHLDGQVVQLVCASITAFPADKNATRIK